MPAHHHTPHHLRTLPGALLPLLALLLLLPGCSSASTTTAVATPVPLRIVSAKVEVNPKNYNGACGATQKLTFTATLTANANHQGGKAHYLWTINHSPVEGDVTLAPGETSATVTRSLDYAIPPDAGPELRASIAITTPNAVSSPDAVFAIGCTVPFRITDVRVTMQPWTARCGPHTFGWAAVITAPTNNAGGTVRYTWQFTVGGSESGTITFAPGQITQVVTASRSYNIRPKGSPPDPSAPPQWPQVTAGQIRAWLYVTSPNSIGDYAVPEAVFC